VFITDILFDNFVMSKIELLYLDAEHFYGMWFVFNYES